ncbi:MAG: hypothetical protein WEA58_11435 [Balneolaceae bacterium]
MQNVVILPESKVKELFQGELEKVLKAQIPQIIRQANRKDYLTTGEVEELTGLSSRAQKYHRDCGNLPYSQEGRKIIYQTVDIEKFIEDRRVKGLEGV